MVTIDQPIKKAMNKLDAASRLIQWAVELSQFNIKYRPRTAIEAQILADFIVELTLPIDEEEKNRWRGEEEQDMDNQHKWFVHKRS